MIADAVMLLPPGAAPNTAAWTPNVASGGQYEVYTRWTQHANRATDAKYTVTHASGTATTTVNQQANGGIWNLLGTYTLNPGTAHKVALTDEGNGYIVADAIRLVPVNVAPQAKLYFIHTDHLNTPRLVADDTQTTVWKWEQQEPFGVNAANDDADGNSVTFEFNLRFPGQYFDKETNAHYNYFRDYDAAIGRYVQSDPIGLRGGLNTYAYVRGKPLRASDLYGLAPGDKFCTVDDAVRDAYDYVFQRPPRDVEYCGFVLEIGQGCYTYDESPVSGVSRLACQLRPQGPKDVEAWHTHGPSGMGGFSPGDYDAVGDLGIPLNLGWLGSPPIKLVPGAPKRVVPVAPPSGRSCDCQCR